jgi:hypothetical protein
MITFCTNVFDSGLEKPAATTACCDALIRTLAVAPF